MRLDGPRACHSCMMGPGRKPQTRELWRGWDRVGWGGGGVTWGDLDNYGIQIHPLVSSELAWRAWGLASLIVNY